MTTTNIHSLVEMLQPIDTDIIVCNSTGKDLPNRVLDKVSKNGFVHNTSFMPFTGNLCLSLDPAESGYQKILEEDVISKQTLEIQKAYKKTIHSFRLKGYRWFAMTKEQWNHFVEWVTPLSEDYRKSTMVHDHYHHNIDIFDSVLFVFLNMYLRLNHK